jgi:hypothetical protein
MEVRMKLLITVIIMCTLMLFVSCSLLVKDEVLYEVYELNSVAALADITYTDEDGTDIIVTSEELPWSETITISQGDDAKLDSVTLSVENSTSTDIGVKITWDK